MILLYYTYFKYPTKRLLAFWCELKEKNVKMYNEYCGDY